MIQNTLRHGNFTSSEIWKLTKKDKSGKKFGAPAITYITETNFERWLDGSVDGEFNSKPTSWGKFLEPRVHNLLGLEYTFSSDITDVHPDIPYWVGSKDGTKEIAERTVFDYKAPFTKKSFVQLVLPLYLGMQGIEVMYALRDGFEHAGIEYPKHPDGEKYFQQLVSNCEINKCEWAELIVYMPYDSELLEIAAMARDNPAMKWMEYAGEDGIPSLKDGGFFKNLNIIRFKVPKVDSDNLTECVLKAGELLIPYPNK